LLRNVLESVLGIFRELVAVYFDTKNPTRSLNLAKNWGRNMSQQQLMNKNTIQHVCINYYELNKFLQIVLTDGSVLYLRIYLIVYFIRTERNVSFYDADLT
jgi:hypothetical protein